MVGSREAWWVDTGQSCGQAWWVDTGQKQRHQAEGSRHRTVEQMRQTGNSPPRLREARSEGQGPTARTGKKEMPLWGAHGRRMEGEEPQACLAGRKTTVMPASRQGWEAGLWRVCESPHGGGAESQREVIHRAAPTP